VVSGTVLVAVPAHAQDSTSNDLSAKEAQLEQIRQQRANLASKLNVLKSTGAQISNALDALDANVQGQSSLLSEARTKANQARQDLAAAQAAEAAKQSQLDSLRKSLRDLALQSYVSPPADLLTTLATSGQSDDQSLKRGLSSLQASQVQNIIDEYGAVRDDLATQRKLTQAASKRADQRTADVTTRLKKFQAAQAQQQTLADQVEVRTQAAEGQSATLAAADTALSGQVAQLRAELQAKLAAAAAAAAAGRGGGGGDPTIIGNGDIVTVDGIEVSSKIAANVAALIAAARADGIILGGSGFRTPAGQIAVRRNNCGSSYYDIYQKPASQCHPPAAPPGTSMHELGLAIDFTANGSLISSHSNPGWIWMSHNAARFGFFNLPSEPWHWSVNGN
jgi:LAS superfamily LD-carboxypeptidase LdcB